MTKQLIGIGNAAIDGTVKIPSDDKLFELGLVKGTCVFVDGSDHRMQRIFRDYPNHTIDSGGSAANTLSAYSALGGTSRFIGKTGQDSHGEFFTNNIHQYGVTFDTPPSNDTESTFLFSVITPDKERSFLSNHGASHKISDDDVAEKWFTPNTSLIIDGYMTMSDGGPKAMFKAMDYAELNNCEIIFMPCSLTVIHDRWDVVSKIISRANAIICNEEEAMAITGTNDMTDIQNTFNWGCITLSERGVFYFDTKNNIEGTMPPPYRPHRIENTNGAGDNFAGGLIYGLHHNMPMDDAVRLGQLCALHVLERTGARCDFDLRHLHEEIR